MICPLKIRSSDNPLNPCKLSHDLDGFIHVGSPIAVAIEKKQLIFDVVVWPFIFKKANL